MMHNQVNYLNPASYASIDSMTFILDAGISGQVTNFEEMVEEIRKELNFTTLRFNRLDDMLDAVGIPKENLCTYCWDGKD